MNTFGQLETTVILIIIILLVWDLVWTMISLWKSARRDQMVWFIVLAIINSAGILPIIYLLIHKGQPEKVIDKSDSDFAESRL